MATWVIGDIQGCYFSFLSLLQRIDFDPHTDRLWLAGDIVNRGTGSLEMLRWAVAHDDVVTAVLGNHETGLLACAAGARKPRKTDTIAPILQADDRLELLSWVQQRPLVHVAQGHVMVHAGLHPRWDLQTCLRRAADPDSLAIDAFTRMRTLRANMTLDHRFTGPPELAPAGNKPWYRLRHFEPGYRVVFGHWAALGLRSSEHWQSLDAGCVWGGSLAAYRLSDGQIVTTPADKRDRPKKK